MPRMRLGIFGGSFDPFHAGHFLVAQAAMEEACLDRVFFVPAAQSPFKHDDQASSAEHRLRWLRLALQGCSDYFVDDQELQRGGVSYAIETVLSYRDRYPDAQLFYLIGADHVPTLQQWRRSPELAQLVEFLIVPRPGEALCSITEPFSGQYLKGFPLEVSSSTIRLRLRERLSIRGLVHPKVEEDIVKLGIYL